jgi:large subunit ribosomal protein L5e
MAFVKVVKNKAYSKRMQVKPKRRRQGKTDYYARRRLVCQDKNKYDSKKYRLVVRRTNARILTQVIFSTLTGDRVLCAAESDELRNHGLTAGLSNYSSAYATGLLIARRLLKQVGLADDYKGAEKVDGEYFNSSDNLEGDRRPFKALLDVGINRTTTGARLFGAMKGACDGGLDVPHSNKRFPGYTKAHVEVVTNKRGKSTGEAEKSEAQYDPKVHRERIMGVHVTKYMNEMKKEDPEKFKRHFSKWSAALDKAKCKTCEDLYTKVHKAIRANPDRVKRAGNKKPTRKVVTKGFELVQQDSKNRKWLRHFRINLEERNARIARKFAAAQEALANQ